MGYLRHETIVVSGWSEDDVLKAHCVAAQIFNEHRLGSLVSGIVRHVVNGGASFFVSPDGSKEGWEPSDRADKARRELIGELRKPNNGMGVDWALILLGGDGGEYRVLSSPNDQLEPAA